MEIKDFSIIMSLVDFIPVILFTVAAVILQRDLYNKMSKGAFALFAAGTIDIVFAGMLKALYKLLYAAHICNFEVLSQLFMPLQALGFLLAGIGIMAMIFHKQSQKMVMSVVTPPAVFSGTPVFIILMVLGLAGMNTGFCIVGAKMKKPFIVVLYVISFICSLAMGYLSSKNFSEASMNWIAECVNVVGQGSFLAGAFLLHRAGFENLILEKSNKKGEKV